MRSSSAMIGAAAMMSTFLVGSVGHASATSPVEQAQQPAGGHLDSVGTALGGCDDLDPRLCLLPFPNDQFTTLDPSTPTGRRVDFDLTEMPRSAAGKPIDPAEWNHNDGFSPGSMILTVVPGLDLTSTFDLDRTPETGVGTSGDPWAVRDEEPDALIEDPERSMAKDAPIVLMDADTGERHPYWAELDEHPETIAEGEDRTLIVRPSANLAEGHRYIVAMRDLRDSNGTELTAPASFASLRDEYTGRCRALGKGRPCGPGRTPFPEPADVDPADRTARYDDIFTRLRSRGVDVRDLHLAWDFHVASGENLAGRALAIRDDAFDQLGDNDLADLIVEGDSPRFTVTGVEEGEAEGHPVRTVHGSVTVPNYLTTPQDGVAEVEGVSVVVPGSRFHYGTSREGPMAVPTQNPAVPTMQAEFVCRFRTDVPGGAKVGLYGHGLLGSRNEAAGGSTSDLRRSGYSMCGVDWIGMATEDITNVALVLNDVSFFPSLVDRAQQGFLGFMYVGRALLHADGLVTDPAFRADGGRPLLDTDELFYDGNSQGGIMGGALTALSPDFTKSVLGVPAMNYSTLLNRSVDWEGELVDPDDPGLPAYASFLYTSYPDKVEQQLIFALIQMIWDRGEGNGYAQHMTADPYPDTPAHQVLLEAAFGDYQVTNQAAEVQGRTIGANFLGSALAPGRHWERDYATGRTGTPYGFTPFATDQTGETRAPSGSALVYWDSGNPTPPNGNVPQADFDQDPHGDPRNDDVALLAKLWFYTTGDIVDVHDGAPNWTFRCPRHLEHDPGCGGR